MTRDRSETAFGLLEKAPGEDLTTRDSGIKLAEGPVLHALDHATRRHLLLPVGQHVEDVEDSKSRGVTVVTRTLVENEHERRFIDIACQEAALKDLFSIVCDEILEHCSRTSDEPGLVAITVLDRWRNLLGPGTSRLLSEQQIKGLLAELHLLEQLAAEAPSEALLLWTGADKSRHDFTGRNVACEVKASSLVDEVKVHINGLNQLVAPPRSELYLLVERLERVSVGGDSIGMVLDRVEAMGVDLHVLLHAVAKVGVQPADLQAYESVRFVSLESRLYEVDEAFPRIVPDMLIGSSAYERVTGVEYVLNLGVEPPAPLGDDVLARLPRLLLQGLV